jgi:hypothetical protein
MIGYLTHGMLSLSLHESCPTCMHQMQLEDKGEVQCELHRLHPSSAHVATATQLARGHHYIYGS